MNLIWVSWNVKLWQILIAFCDLRLEYKRSRDLNLKDNSIIWRSEPLTSNCNFTIIKDNIVCGYGFTAEPDFIYIINKYSGRRLEKIKLNSGPSCILEKNETLYVRTYDTDYKFNIMK